MRWPEGGGGGRSVARGEREGEVWCEVGSGREEEIYRCEEAGGIRKV